MAPVLALVLTALVALSPASALWPLPTSLQTGSTGLLLAPNFNIKLSVGGAPADLQAAVKRTEGYLKTDKLGRLVVGRGANDSSAIHGAKQLSSLTVSLSSTNGTVRSISEEAMDDLEQRDEAYSLTVPEDGSAATLTANSTLGLFRGLTTFGQLWYDFGGKTYTLEAPIQIKDAPAYVRSHSLSGDLNFRLIFCGGHGVALPWIHAGHR
jgi:hexosaminidase